MQTDVRTVAPDTLLRGSGGDPLPEQVRLFARPRMGTTIVGIITEADFLRLAIALLHDA